MFCAFLDCMSQKTWSYVNGTVRNFKFMLAFELSRFWTVDVFTYMFLVMSIPCVSFILIVSYLNQQLMHLFYTSRYITFCYAFRRTSAPSSDPFNSSVFGAYLAINNCPNVLVKCVLLIGAILFIISDLRDILNCQQMNTKYYRRQEMYARGSECVAVAVLMILDCN